jgi:hypothetical protein
VIIRKLFFITVCVLIPAPLRAQPTSREIMVTTLQDYRKGEKPIPGSLRWAVHQKGPCIIRFSVGGNIDLADKLVISEPYLAIDGSTAPGDGITLRRIQVEVTNTHDVVLRYLRFRCGDGFADDPTRKKVHGDYNAIGHGGGGWRSLLIYGTKKEPTQNILIENCSIQNSTDDNANVWGNCRGITFRQCLISGGYAAVDVRGESICASKGLLAGVEPGKPNVNAPDYLTIDKCIFAFLSARAPDINGGVAQLVNCLIVGTRQGGIMTNARANIVNNSFWTLPNHPWGTNADRLLTVDPAQAATGSYYLSGNLLDGVPANLKAMGERNKGQTDVPGNLLAPSKWPGLPADVLPAIEAQKLVLQSAGCTQPRRDAHDEQVISRIKARISHP